MGPVGVAVRLQPFVLGPGQQEAVEVAAGVDTLPSPIGRREERYLDLPDVDRPRPVPVVVERVLLDRCEVVHPVGREFIFWQRHRSRHRLACVGVDRRTVAATVLNRVDLGRLPSTGELTEDPPVIKGVPVLIVEAFPGDERRQVGSAAGGGRPAHDGVVGDAEYPDLSRAPRPGTRPFDARADVLEFLG